ncbi:hypothetical protein [Sphingobium sp. CFD-2]|uniref:hypothetical protein n=1 Tax=Sphingobium sp. CFD-2 TaxID=2878542 RepID=UPI00214B4187|nr:hypothetical protein [Sphingobium sp. CFD-2]
MIDWHKPDALKDALAAAKVSFGDFAILSNVSKAQLYRLNNGEGKPRWDTDRKIRIALDKLQDSCGRNNATKRKASKPAQTVCVEGRRSAGKRAAA